MRQAGLRALSNTFAGIYFIPFKTGISLQFSFSGQSIPNRRGQPRLPPAKRAPREPLLAETGAELAPRAALL